MHMNGNMHGLAPSNNSYVTTNYKRNAYGYPCMKYVALKLVSNSGDCCFDYDTFPLSKPMTDEK